jgi:hypothetical protein
MFAILPTLLLVASVVAAPAKFSDCDLSKTTIPASPLAAPTTPLKFIGLGVGVQNYTCGPAGTYV